MAGLQVSTLVLFLLQLLHKPLHKPSAGFSIQSGVNKSF